MSSSNASLELIPTDGSPEIVLPLIQSLDATGMPEIEAKM